MTNLEKFHRSKYRRLLHNLCGLMLFFVVGPSLYGANPPKELSKVIDGFLGMEMTSVNITQVIDWRFSSKRDTVRVQMNIKGSQNFHVLLAGFGMEIYVHDDQMITLNHLRQQILYETANPDALLEQLFVGGDLSDARFKGEKQLDGDRRRLKFLFDTDFSDWESLSVVLDGDEILEKLLLVDYDGNKYIITLNYSTDFNQYDVPKIDQDYLHYQIADLRGKR